MARKVFNRFGLKRSLNLSDLPDKKIGLNNILDGLAADTETFTVEDIDAIKNLSSTDVDSATFIQGANATVKFTDSSTGQLVPFDPLITLSNRFDNAYFTTSEPFFAGGDGLTAKYYDNSGILRVDSNQNLSTTATDIFSGFDTAQLVKTDNFWEKGSFTYENKIVVDFTSLYGGVEWEGYIKPSQNGSHSLIINTTGFLKVEFDDLTESQEFSFDASTGTYNYDNYDFTKLNTLTNQTRIQLIDNGGVDEPIIYDDVTSSLTSSKLGENRTVTIPLGVLTQWVAYKIRISFFIDEAALDNDFNEGAAEKSIDIDLSSPTNRSSLNYKKLFTKNYFQNYDIGNFRAFVENSISLGGTEVGERGSIGSIEGTISSALNPTPRDSYRSLNNINPIISYYKFPKQKSDVELDISGCSVIKNNKIITISNASPNSTEGIEIGNFVFGSGIKDGTRVTDVVVNSNVVVSPAPVANGSSNPITLTFVDHRGLVGFGTGIINTYPPLNIPNNTANEKVIDYAYGYKLDQTNTNNIILGSDFTTPRSFVDVTDNPQNTNTSSYTGELTKKEYNSGSIHYS